MRSSSLLFALLVAASLTACGPPPNGDGSAEQPNGIVDCESGGDPLRYDAPPGRILPANAAALDFVAALVEPERIIAIPETAALYSSVSLDDPLWQALPTLVDYTAESVLALEPALVIAHEWQDANATSILRGAGIAVVELPAATEVEQLVEIIRYLGGLLHATERAQALAEQLEARHAALLADAPEQVISALVYSNYGTGGWSAGSGTAEDLFLRLAGVRNAVAAAGIEQHEELDIERLLSLAPDVIVMCTSAESSKLSATRAYLEGEPLLQALPAVRDQRYVMLPVRLYSATSHRLIDAAEAVREGLRELESRDP